MKKETKSSNISRRDFLRKGGKGLLIWQGAVIAGSAMLSSNISCKKEDTNTYK
jgi:hypothetical protein